MQQYGPYPNDLENIVAHLHYRPGWLFTLSDIERDPESSHGAAAGGLTLTITTLTHNSYDPALSKPFAWREPPSYRVHHYFIVPAATYNWTSWIRWVFDCIVKVETHECMEFFALESDDGLVRPFAPTHGPGDDPYIIHEYASNKQRRTRFTGEVLDGD